MSGLKYGTTEWFSAEDVLPERDGRYFVYGYVDNNENDLNDARILKVFYSTKYGWDRRNFKVTAWTYAPDYPTRIRRPLH